MELTNTEMKALRTHCEIHARGYGDDLMQHTILIALESGYKEQNMLPLLKRIAFNQAHNTSSDFNKQHRPKKPEKYEYLLSLEPKEDQSKWDTIQPILDEYPKDKRQLFLKELYMEYLRIGSVTKLARETKINKKTIYKALKRYEQHIRNRIS